MKNGFYVLILALGLLACQAQPPLRPIAAKVSAGIVGGEKADQEMLRSVLAVIDLTDDTICSATLIAPHVALTAAHCVADTKHDRVLQFGPDLNSESAFTIEIDQVITYPFYAAKEKRERGDLALIYFSARLPDFFRPIVLAEFTDLSLVKKSMTLVGYGSSQYQVEDSKILRMVTRSGSVVDATSTDFMIDITDGKGTCSGDSGGPLLVKKKDQLLLVGIDSAGVKFLDPKTGKVKKEYCTYRTLYTNAVPFRAWIQETLETFPIGEASPKVEGESTKAP